MDHPFRSAALGGFNKQDVLTFLEEQAKQTAQAQQQLQEQLEESGRQLELLRQEKADLNGRLEQARMELEALRQERDSLDSQLNQTRQELSGSQDQTGQTVRELEELRQERDRLQASLEEAQPDAQAYAKLKERTAGMELEAHLRAHTIQAKAENDARQLRVQMEQWIQQMERAYEAAREELASTISHADSELEKVRAGLERINGMVCGQETALRGISKAYVETAPQKGQQAAQKN